MFKFINLSLSLEPIFGLIDGYLLDFLTVVSNHTMVWYVHF